MSDLILTELDLFSQELVKDLFWASSQFYQRFGRGAIDINLNDQKLLKIIKGYREGRTNKRKLTENLGYIPLDLEKMELSGIPDVDSILKKLHDILLNNEEAQNYKPSLEGIGVLSYSHIPVKISESYEELMTVIKITRFGVKNIQIVELTERKQEGE
ncbi:hypothetical protein [Crocosphaera sp. Alani8]|uniref:hypothetical protein n=1 Tax=Crocosphaera sp. Alani8 TaxID=3038952 RepID=UPI00313EACAD